MAVKKEPAASLRTTRQRQLILDIIKKGKGHLDADEIHRLAQKAEPRLSLSTVYRNLLRFKQLGLIDELHFDEGHHHYEVKAKKEHHHLKCLNCGRVIEFNYPIASQIIDDVLKTKGFEVTGTEICLSGYCNQCRGKK